MLRVKFNTSLWMRSMIRNVWMRGEEKGYRLGEIK